MSLQTIIQQICSKCARPEILDLYTKEVSKIYEAYVYVQRSASHFLSVLREQCYLCSCGWCGIRDGIDWMDAKVLNRHQAINGFTVLLNGELGHVH